MLDNTVDDRSHDDEQAEAQDSGSGNTRLVLWLVVMSMSFLVIPVFLAGNVIQEERLLLEQQLAGLQAELDEPTPVDPEVERLEAQLLDYRNATSELEMLTGTLQAENVDWSLMMRIFIEYDPHRMALTSITHTGQRITMNGQAVDEADLMAYVDILQESGLFTQVILQSINRAVPEVGEDGQPVPAHMPVEFVILCDVEGLPA